MTIGLVLLGCNINPMEQKIVGNWQAIEVTEQDSVLTLPLAEVKMRFSKDKKYTFESTLNYKEAGTYQLQNNMLFLKDTTPNNIPKKVIKINYLANDSLIVEMKATTNTRLLKLVKIQKDTSILKK